MARASGKSRRWAVGAALGGVASVALPLAAAQPAAAQYSEGDFQHSQVTFVRNGRSLTCAFGGQTAYWFPRSPGEETAQIRVITITADQDGCYDAIQQVSLSGTYETAPDSNQFVSFSDQGAPASGTTPGENEAYTFLEVPGPTGRITATHVVQFRCDNPPAGATYCSGTVTTSAK